MDQIKTFVTSPVFLSALIGAWGGFVAAYRQDRETFKRWLVERDADFDWQIALRRWLLGAATGFVSVLAPGLGLDFLL